MSHRIFVRAGARIESFPLNSVLVLGGVESSGVPITGLKGKDDYALLNVQDKQVQVHPLRGRKSVVRKIETWDWITVEDLEFFVAPESVQANETWPRFIADLKSSFARLKDSTSVERTFLELLNSLLQSVGMQKGLIIACEAGEDSRILLQLNVKGDETWLSETIVQETQRSQKPLFVGHVGSSAFASSRSLVGGGMISVLSLPLVSRGQVLGVCLLGSEWPHPGLGGELSDKAELLADLMSLLLDDHMREKALAARVEMLNQARRSTKPFLTGSAVLEQALTMAEKVAPSGISVLVQGETGVGKECMARWIHDCSDRRTGPFIAVNCGAIPSELLESLLFGHRKGSFTGAIRDEGGKIRQAHGGTLFLDEIGDLPQILQVKLLRFLQERKVEPIGGRDAIAVDVRVVSASNKSLRLLIDSDEFRSDLYYRLAEVTVHIPPLRERRGDIRLLANHFLTENRAGKTFHHSALRWLDQQEWTGNVRELQSAIRRASIMSVGDEILPEDFLQGAPAESESPRAVDRRSDESLDQARDRFTYRMVEETLARHNGHREKAAQDLGITARTLFRYLEEMKSLSVGMTKMSDAES